MNKFGIDDWTKSLLNITPCKQSSILLFVKICVSVFPFDVWDGLWVLIRPVPEVSLLL